MLLRVKERAKDQGSPGFALILLTMLAAAFAFSIHARGIASWWKYPVLSLRDPVRVLFVLGEHERHLALAESGKNRFDTDETEAALDLEDWDQLRAEVTAYTREPGANEEWLAPLKSVDVVFPILVAGYGSAKALRALETIDKEPPHYAKTRLEELRSGAWERDRARASAAARWGTVLGSLRYASLAAGGLGLLILWRGKRWFQRPAVTRIVGLPLSRALFVFAGAEAALATIYWLVGDAPSITEIPEWLPPVVSAFAVVALVQSVSGTWGASPLARTLTVPATGGERRYLVLLTLIGLGASHGFHLVAHRVAYQFGLQSRVSEGVMESILYGSTLDAWLAAVGLATVTPVAEELLFRGVLFGGLAQRISAHWAALLSGALFALSHGYGLVGSLSLMATGYILARVYQYSGSLLPCIALHAVNNVVAGLWEAACRT
jgi:membrane protease YdiL (CAAX protease family)